LTSTLNVQKQYAQNMERFSYIETVGFNTKVCVQNTGAISVLEELGKTPDGCAKALAICEDKDMIAALPTTLKDLLKKQSAWQPKSKKA